jgi:ATP-dependent helicase/DNAse subunit B
LVAEVRDNLVYFTDKLGIKGFSEALLGLVAELKHAKVEPDRILELSEMAEDNEFKLKLKDLHLIYSGYQQNLKTKGFIDDIDKLRLLSEAIVSGELANVLPQAKSFVVFGFYDFTPSQLEVLQSINKAGHGLAIYIPSLAATSKLKDMVMHKMRYWLGDFQMENFYSQTDGKRQIEIHSFPSFREEAEFAGREVKRLLLSNSANPDEVAVVVRSLAGKENYLSAAFEKMGIPYSFSKETSLRNSLLGRLVIELIKVKSLGFEKKNFLNLLRSPYLSRFFNQDSNFGDFISELDKASRKQRVLKGSKSWKRLLDHLSNGSYSSQAKKIKEIVDKIEKRLNSRHLWQLIEDLADILDELLVYKVIEDSSLNSDLHLQAWKSFYKFIKEIRYLSQTSFKNKKVSLSEFISLLEDLWSEETYSASSEEKGNGVQIIDVLKFRGTSFPVVFMLDVGEKSFPAPARRDPILKHDERIEINNLLGSDSLTIDDRHYDDEEFLFNLISGSASKKLYITYSYLDENERSSLPSYLVEEISEREGVGTKRHSPEESFIYPENIYSKTNLAKHIFYKNLYKKEEYRECLGENAALILDGIMAEGQRLFPRGTFSEFEGIIGRTELLPSLSEFSPTSLETYGDCPFKYFAGEVLKLEFPEEPEDEVMGLDLGSFYHRVLKNLFSSLAGRMGGKVDLTDVLDNELIDLLNKCIEKEDLDKEFGWLSQTVRELIENRIVEKVFPQFMVAEAERIREWNKRGFFPERFEKKIGFDMGDIKISGQIDRIDIGDNRALVIDYKLRSSNRKQFFDYINLQLPIYLSALRNEGIEPYGGYYRFVEKPHLESGAIGGGRKTIDELINSAMSQVEMYVSLMREGFFAPVIQKKDKGFEREEIEVKKDEFAPCSWCEFKDLCRVQGGTVRKL